MKSLLKSFYLLLACGLTLSSASLAQTTSSPIKMPLFVATSDAFQDPLDVNLTVDIDVNATGFLYTLQKIDTAVSLEHLPTGITLYQMSGKNVAVLTSKTFSSVNGGPLVLTYLHDGIQDSYAKFNFSVSREGQNWVSSVMDANGIPRIFTTMNLVAKKVFGKVIGIDKITVK